MSDSNIKETTSIKMTSWPFLDIILLKQETLCKIRKLLIEQFLCKINKQLDIPEENQALLFRHRVSQQFQAKHLSMVTHHNAKHSHILVAIPTLGPVILSTQLEEESWMFLQCVFQTLQLMKSLEP